MNAVIRPLPERELLIEDLELRDGDDLHAFASVVAVARFYEDGTPYLYEAVEKDTGRSLSLPSAWVELLERRLEERYAPRKVEEY